MITYFFPNISIISFRDIFNHNRTIIIIFFVYNFWTSRKPKIFTKYEPKRLIALELKHYIINVIKIPKYKIKENKIRVHFKYRMQSRARCIVTSVKLSFNFFSKIFPFITYLIIYTISLSPSSFHHIKMCSTLPSNVSINFCIIKWRI